MSRVQEIAQICPSRNLTNGLIKCISWRTELVSLLEALQQEDIYLLDVAYKERVGQYTTFAMKESSAPQPLSFGGHSSHRRIKIFLLVVVLVVVAVSVALLVYFFTRE